MRRVLALLAALAVGASSPVRAETAALASRDAALARSLRAALAPRGIRVTVVADEPPPRTGDVLAFARSVSAREDAAAVVWVADADDGTSTLLVFDRDVDRVLQRPLGWAQPFGAEQAIAAARTVRTMLRALRVTPDIDLAPPLAVEAPRVREEAARVAVAAAPAPRAEGGRLTLESGGGVRLGGVDEAGWRVTAGLAVRLAPLVAAASATLGGAETVRAAGFAGDYRDHSVAALVRLPRRLGPLLLEPGAGAAIHVARLAGSIEGGGAVSDRRLDPALRAQTFVGWRPLEALEVGVSFTLDALLRRQRYLMVGDEEVLGVPAWQGAVDLLVRLRGM
jgi:hypothetical protein